MIPPDVKLTEILESYFGVEAGRDDSLLRELQTEHLTGGEWLFRQGDPGDSFYFLIRGETIQANKKLVEAILKRLFKIHGNGARPDPSSISPRSCPSRIIMQP